MTDVIESLLIAPATSVSVPKFVLLQVTPAITPVLLQEDTMLPLASGVPAVGWTWRPLIVMTSGPLFDALAEYVIVAAEAVTLIDAALRLKPDATETLPVPAWNWKPLGTLSTSVIPRPLLKSVLLFSVMTMFPRVVHVALPVLSAEMLEPPVAVVTVTFAHAIRARTSAIPIATTAIPARVSLRRVRRM